MLKPLPCVLVIALSACRASSPTAPAPVVATPTVQTPDPVPPVVTGPRLSVLVFDGNSLTASRGGVPAYPDLIAIPSNIVTANVAARGNTTVEQDAMAPAAVDALHRDGVNLVVFWEGANDLYFGSSPQKAIENLRLYAQHRHAAGFRVILGSLFPRSDAGVPNDYEVKRQAVNAWLRANWRETAEGFIDFGADPDMGQAGQWANLTYFQADRAHLAAGGAARVAGKVAEALAVFDARIH